MKFEDILPFLKNGHYVSRIDWPKDFKLGLHKPINKDYEIITEPCLFFILGNPKNRQVAMLTASDILAEDWFFYQEVEINFV